MPIDKREHTRHLKRIKLRYRSPGERWHTAFSKDISTNGIFIITQSIPTSRELEIEVVYGDEILSLKGRVLRGKTVPPRLRGVEQGGVAVRLIDVSDDWCRLCLDLEEKLRERGGDKSSRFISVTTDVSEPDS